MCSKCTRNLNIENFSKNRNNSDGHTVWCKSCTSTYMKLYRERPGGREYMKPFEQTYNRTHRLKYKYGITADDYLAMFQSQLGKCKICKTETPGTGQQNFHIDHDHVSGKIRGLLCRACNSLLGYSKDSIEILQASIDYLIDSHS